MRLLWMALAGALGTLARYGFSLLTAPIARGTGFPIGTLLVNVLGSFLLGFIFGLALTRVSSHDLRLVVGVGFLGAFTTFSTFELETYRLLTERAYGMAAMYVFGNLVLGFAAVVAGQALAERITG